MSDRLVQLEKLHNADPRDAFLTYAIAMELLKADKPEDAVTWLDKTLALDGNYCYAYFQKGKALSSLGEDGQAKQVITQGLEVARKVGDQKAISELGELLAGM